jgi:hypothetical protein
VRAAFRRHDAGQLSAHLPGKSGADGTEYLPLGARLSHRGCVFMPDRVAHMRHGPRAERAAPIRGPATRAARLTGILLSGALLAACSSSGDTGFSFFAEPGKYQFHTCAQIADAMKSQSQHVQDLKNLIDRADQSTGGAAVGFLAYKADYLAAEEELGSLRSAARSKSCDQDATWRSSTVIR